MTLLNISTSPFPLFSFQRFSFQPHELGWRPRIDLERGMRDVYQWFVENSGYAKH